MLYIDNRPVSAGEGIQINKCRGQSKGRKRVTTSIYREVRVAFTRVGDNDEKLSVAGLRQIQLKVAIILIATIISYYCCFRSHYFRFKKM